MKTATCFSTSILLLLVWSGSGCYTRSEVVSRDQPSLSDTHAFAAILGYYRSTFPSDFDGFLHAQDGPTGRLRLHIQVPVAIEAEYQHPFSRAFLISRSKNPDGLARNVSKDLL